MISVRTMVPDVLQRFGAAAAGGTPAEPFILEFVTDGASQEIGVPTDAFIYDGGDGAPVYNGHLQWLDSTGTTVLTEGAFTAYTDAIFKYTPADAGTYRCSITGIFTVSAFRNANLADTSKITKLIQFGGQQVQSGFGFLNGCTNLNSINWAPFSNTSAFFDRNGIWNRMAYDCDSLTTVDMTGWSMYPPVEATRGFINSLAYCDSLVSVDFSDGLSNGAVSLFTNTFAYSPSLTTIDWGTSRFDSLVSMLTFCVGSTSISAASYDEFLNLAASQIGDGLPSAVSINWQDGGTGVNYTSAGATARADLVTHGWSILDGGLI